MGKSKNIFNKVIIVLTLSVLTAAVLRMFLLKEQDIRSTDFVSYYMGGKMIREGQGEYLFHPGTSLRSLPITGLVFSPFSYMPIEQSYKLFLLLNLACLFILCYSIYKYTFFDLGRDIYTKNNMVVLILLSLIPAVLAALWNGQISLILTILLFGFFVLAKKKKYFMAAMLLALVLIKPQYLTVVPFVLVTLRNKKFYLSFLIFILFFTIVNIVIAGVDFPLRYLNFVLTTETPDLGSPIRDMFSLFGLLRLFGLDIITSISINTLMYIITFIYFLKQLLLSKNNNIFELAFPIYILLSITFSVHVLLQDMVLLFIPLTFLIRSYIEGKVTFRLTDTAIFAAPLFSLVRLSPIGGVILGYSWIVLIKRIFA